MITAIRLCCKKITCSKHMSNFSKIRESRILQKMLNRAQANELEKKADIHKNKVITKGYLFSPYDDDCGYRSAALNKVYMEHISSMISSGKYYTELQSLEIEITKVKLAKGHNFLNVYFISRKPNIPDDILKNTLNGVLAELQAKIGEVKFIGKVPYLKFIRDGRLENAIHVEHILKIIDCGKNFKPTDGEEIITPNSLVKPDDLPVMRQNVYGINVDKIKEKITADIVRKKVTNSNKTENYSEPDSSRKLMEFNKKDFYKFFKSRRIAEMKRRKMELRQEMDSFNNGFNESFNFFNNKFEDEYDEFEDEYDEFEDECDESKDEYESEDNKIQS